ncbi:FAD:protein FMN transferase [Rhodobacteraceae bacterium DSL-40]|uniref:FAD:protein FMN transferase n=1 Tax=Amaricoccus sp. B4 TaxID=3368557 RepID=UPI0013A6B612
MRPTRRHFLVIAASAASAAALARWPERQWDWRGDALGAEARIRLTGPRDAAEAAIAAITAEIDRLESVFSLHRPASDLARLNARGRIAAPSRDLLTLLERARHWTSRTEGAFDPAVQPLWQAALTGAGTEAALARVRGARIATSPGVLQLSGGTALTLDGIAQGYIADRVADLVLRHGFHAPLIDTGEMRFTGEAPQTLRLPEGGETLRLTRCAAATSAPAAMRLPRGHHLFDPRSGLSPELWRSVTVIAPEATDADALSTAFAVSPRARIGDLVPPGTAVFAIDREGRLHRFGRAEGLA